MTVRKFGPVQCFQRKLKSFDQIIKNVLHRFSFQKSFQHFRRDMRLFLIKTIYIRVYLLKNIPRFENNIRKVDSKVWLQKKYLHLILILASGYLLPFFIIILSKHFL